MGRMNNRECMVWLGWIKEDEWYGRMTGMSRMNRRG